MPGRAQRGVQLAREAQVVLELGNAARADRAGLLEVMPYVNRDRRSRYHRNVKSEDTKDTKDTKGWHRTAGIPQGSHVTPKQEGRSHV
jgi:hypothetical protein